MNSVINRISANGRYMAMAFAGITSASYPTRLFSASAPTNNESTLSVKGTSEYDHIGFNEEVNKFLFMTSISAPYIETQNRSAIDLVCVLDESGSMSGEPIELLKESMKFIVSNLTSNDRFGCVGYESVARQICPFKYMTSDTKHNALKQINSMESLNMTALCDGLEMGVNMMRDGKTKDNKNDIDYKNRVKNILLLTDGVANVGYTDPKDIIKALTDKEFADAGRKEANNGYRRSRNVKLGNLKKYAETATQFTELKPENSDDIYTTLPCNIDTFGFGVHHDDMMLKMISEYGRGLYAFISGKEDIIGTFGEMLGGMLSVVGKDIKIRIKCLNDDVKILKCLAIDNDNKTMKLREIEKDKSYEISILNDIQSEENRDLLFELSIPKTNISNNNWNFMQIECEYFNVITNKLEQISTVCEINRSNDIDKQNRIRNYDIDIQYNRMITTNAIKNALNEANDGNLDKAKKIIINAQEEIKNSVSKDDEYCVSLINDLDNCVSGMESKATYNDYGRKYGTMTMSLNVLQRSYQSESYFHDEEDNDSVPESSKYMKTKSKHIWRGKAQTK